MACHQSHKFCVFGIDMWLLSKRSVASEKSKRCVIHLGKLCVCLLNISVVHAVHWNTCSWLLLCVC